MTVIYIFNSSNNEYNMKRKIDNTIRGFVNGNNGCYANSSIQCLFNVPHMKIVIESLHNSVLKDVLTRYSKSDPDHNLDLINLRSIFYRHEQKFQQQDAAEFIGKLLEDLENISLKKLCQYDELNYIKCSNENCNYENKLLTQYTMRNLIIPERKQNHLYQMQEIIDYNMQNLFYLIPNSVCEKCQFVNKKQTVYLNFNDVVIFFLTLFDSKNGNKLNNVKFDSKNLNQKNIVLDNNVYEFSSAVQHHGKNIQNGHYTSILKKNDDYFHVDDNNVQKITLPIFFENIYILMYTKNHYN